MSQAKVDAYKAEKVNRKANVKKEKAKRGLRVGITTVICVAIIGYIGFSAYNSMTAKESGYEYAEINIDSIDDYMAGLAD